MTENLCVDYCLRRVNFAGQEMHLHALRHGLFVNIWGPAGGDDFDQFLARTTYHSKEDAEAAFTEAEQELLELYGGEA